MPLTLARLPEHARYAVFEIGMNHQARSRRWSTWCVRMWRLVTRSRRSISNISKMSRRSPRAKAEIFSGVVKGGVAIVNRDIDTFPLLEAAAKASPAGYVLSFGANIAADAHLTKFDPEDSFSRVSARVLGQDVHFNLGAPGRHMAINALGVLLAARAVGLDFASIAASLAEVAPAQGRGARETLWLDRADSHAPSAC